jgi:hypothetical protein
MSGMLGVLLASGGTSRFQMAVSYYSDGFKGAYWIYYGFGTISAYYNLGGILSPTAFKGQTVQSIYSVEDNVGSTWPVGLQLQGDVPASFATALTMGGTKYTFDGYGQDYASNQTVTITVSTATFTVSSTTGIMAGTPVKFSSSGALPTGLVAGTKYYARDVTATTFKVSATSGGAAITLSGSQSGTQTVYWDIYSRFTAATATPSNKTGARTPIYPSINIASPATITSTGHGLVNGDRVLFQTTGILPTGISANAVYFVINAATNTFQISATSGGSAIGTSGTQSGTHTCFEVVDVTVE